MLPSFLYPSYKQYKVDTDHVATWLADTAKRCGYPRDSLNKTTPKSLQKAPKLKGRARKLARDAAKKTKADAKDTSSPSKLTPDLPQYLISISDFIVLADWIAKSTKPLIEVPSTFGSVLERAIAVRKKHVHWWYSKDERSSTSSNSGEIQDEGHTYFVGVLEQVRDILRPRMVSNTPTNTLAQELDHVHGSTKASEEHFTNQFTNLNIEDSSEQGSDSTPPLAPQPLLSEPEEAYSVQQPTDVKEACFAVHCLFNDFKNIRKYIQQVWKGYKHGVFDLIAASITTDTAIGFARRLQEDFVEIFPEHADFQKHFNVLYAKLNLSRGYDIDYKEESDDEMNFKIYDEADEFLFPAYSFISSFHATIKEVPIPIYKPGHCGIYDASSNRDLKSSKDKFREDKVLFFESFTDFNIFAQAPDKIPAEDELIRGVREMRKENGPPLWLALAVQIFLDIHHTLRKEVDVGFSDLIDSARYVESNIQQIIEFHEDLRVDRWPQPKDEIFHNILEMINTWVKNDALEVARSQIRIPSRQLPRLEPHKFLKTHPWYCGLLSFGIKKYAQDASIHFVNVWGSIMCSAHLYNTVRQEKLLSNSWRDMDFALSVHKSEDIFIGDYPKNASDYFKRFVLAVGASPTMFARDKRRKGVVASKQGPRCLDDISPISAMFKSRYCYHDDRTELSPADVEVILKAYDDQEDDALSDKRGKRRFPYIDIIVDKQPSPVGITEEQPAELPKQRQKDLRQSAAAGIRPIYLLNALLESIQAEIPELSFDHLRLHRSSWMVLRAVQQTLHEDLKETYGDKYIDKESQLPRVVGYILMTAANVSKFAEEMLPKHKDIISSRMLLRAAEAMEIVLRTGAGRIGLEILKDRFGFEIEVPDFLETPKPPKK